MLAINNHTPFEPMIAVFPDAEGVDTLHVFMQATFTLHGGRVEIAERQVPVQLVDEYLGKPGASSLLRAGQLHVGKPSTDVVMVGDAISMRPVSEMNVELVVGPVRKVVRVFGDREWQGVLGDRISHPIPFDRMPLVYERAVGGTLEINRDGKIIRFDARNPVGVGPARLQGRSEVTQKRLPNLEDPLQLIRTPTDEPIPACFGFVAPSWEPRRLFAGTYDETWATTRAPFLPKDFDPRFFNTAPPSLVCKTFLQGGEPLRVLGASPYGPLNARIPRCDLDVWARIAGKIEPVMMRLETVLVEPNEMRIGLSFQGSVRCDKRILQVEEIHFGLQSIDIDTRAA